MKRVLFLLFLFSCFTSHAQFIPGQLTKDQTLYLIDSITHSNDRKIKNSYSYENDKLLLSTEVRIIHTDRNETAIAYEKYYHENGKLQREGLSADSEIGTWRYYDTLGVLFKEYDFSTNKRTLYGMETEPLDAAFDSVIRMTEQFAIRHFGEAFYKKNMRINKNVSWSPGRYQPHGNRLPNTPPKPAKEYSVHAYVVFNDSIDGPGFTVNFDRQLRITWVSYIRDTAHYYPKINYGYNYAMKIAKTNGFKDVYLGDWDEEKQVYYWNSSITLSTEGNDWHQTTHGKCLKINSQTGKYSITPCDGGFDADGFISDFQKEWKDTVKTSPVNKQISFAGTTIDFPFGWVMVENYHYKTYEDSYYMTNGSDTLRMNQFCGDFVGAEPQLLYGDDHVPRDVEDKVQEENFRSYFQDGKVQGREMKIKIIQHPNKEYSIIYSITESGVAFNCGPIVYKFEAHHLSSEGKIGVLEILKTIRFSTY